MVAVLFAGHSELQFDGLVENTSMLMFSFYCLFSLLMHLPTRKKSLYCDLQP